MPAILPSLEFCRDKINKNCNVVKAKLLAVAFEPSGSIITDATNRAINGTPNKWTIHAEDFLVKKLLKLKARERYKKIYVLVVRWSIVNSWTTAKPCKHCFRILKKYGVDKVFYTDINGKIAELKQ